MKTINVEQRTDEWFSLRQGKITGSKLNDIITRRGSKRKLGFYELMAERLGLQEVSEETAMDRGSRLEAEARALFEAETSKKVEEVGFCISENNPNIALSPDGLILNDGKYTEAVEIKCLSSSRHLQMYFERELDNAYEAQAMQYFIVNPDLDKLYFVFFDPRITVKPMFIHEINRVEVETQIEFYRDYQEQTLDEINKLIEELAF